MDLKSLYSNKAQLYHKYRWDYAPAAIDAIFAISGLAAQACAADIGAGSGIFTRHLTGRAAKVFAVEPNAAMRQIAAEVLAGLPGCAALEGSADATGLESQSVDLITAAQAVHWFDPLPTRREFARILKPGGWLALLRNYSVDSDVNREVSAICTPRNGVQAAHPAPAEYQRPASFYFGGEQYQTLRFPFAFEQDWDAFFGALITASDMPDEDHPAFARLRRAARKVFQNYSQGGVMTVHGETELLIGQPNDGGVQ